MLGRSQFTKGHNSVKTVNGVMSPIKDTVFKYWDTLKTLIFHFGYEKIIALGVSILSDRGTLEYSVT